jgi:pyrroline-5-carboxylate reductase
MTKDIIHLQLISIKMETKSLGFIGGGRVTRILLQAFKNKNAQFSKIVVTDPNQDVTDKLKESFPNIQVDHASVAASQDIVFISLHPPVVMDTLELVKNQFKASSIVISLAPKITIEKISSKLSQVKNTARLIPNATSFINEGYNPVCFSSEFNGGEKQKVLDLLRLLGNTFVVPEEKLESYAIMSAMLPTYFWFQWKELTEIGIRTGLTEEESKNSINDTIIASLNLMFKSGLTPAEVMNLIPVKPIGEHEVQISEIYRSKLIPLFEKIRP